MKYLVLLLVFSSCMLSYHNPIHSQCSASHYTDASCNPDDLNYSNVVIGEVSGDSGQSDGCNDGIVEIVGPPGTNIGCMVVTNSEWAVLIPPNTPIPADGVFLIACSQDPNASCGVNGNAGSFSSGNGQYANGDGDFNNGIQGEIDLDVCQAGNSSFYDPAATGFTIDNSSATDGDQVMIFLPNGTPHDGIYWGTTSSTAASTSTTCPGPGGDITVGGASGAADAVVVQIAGQTYTLGDNDQNGVINDSPVSFYFSDGTSGRGDRGTMCGATMVPILPTHPDCPCNTPDDPGTFTMPSLSDSDFWFDMNGKSATYKGCNSSYGRIGTDNGAHGDPSHVDGLITSTTLDTDTNQPIDNGGGAIGGTTGDPWTPSIYTPSSCGTQAELEDEWGYTDHPTPGVPNNDPAFVFYGDNFIICDAASETVTFTVEVYNYQHVSDNMDVLSGTTNANTGSYVFNPLTGANEIWDTYMISGETTTMTYTISSAELMAATPGTYTFGLVWDDFSNCCGTSGNPHSQSNPNECYERDNLTIEIVEPITATDAMIDCDAGDSPTGTINVNNFISGGSDLTFELFSDNPPTAPNSMETNTSGVFQLPVSAALPSPIYTVVVTDGSSCTTPIMLTINDNCEEPPVCPENFEVSIDGGAGPVNACPGQMVELCFDGDQLPSGGTITWQVDSGSGFMDIMGFDIPEPTVPVAVYISAVFPDPASSGSPSVGICGFRSEWVVITNADLSNSADITGFTLEDNSGVFWTAPVTTIIPAGANLNVCANSVSRLRNANDFVSLFDDTSDQVSNVMWSSTPGDDTSAGSDIPPVPSSDSGGYDSTPVDKEFCVMYAIPASSCPSGEFDFRAMVTPFDTDNCPVGGDDESDGVSATVEASVSCPDATISAAGFDICVADVPVNIPVTILGGTGPYIIEYAINGVTQTALTNFSTGDNIGLSSATDGEVKVTLVSVTDEAGTMCSGAVNDAEVCVNIRPTVTLQMSTTAMAAASCNMCNGQVTFELTAGTSSNSFDIDYTVDGALQSLSSVSLPFTLTNACPGEYVIVGASDDFGCAMMIDAGNTPEVGGPSEPTLTAVLNVAAFCNDASLTQSFDFTNDMILAITASDGVTMYNDFASINALPAPSKIEFFNGDPSTLPPSVLSISPVPNLGAGTAISPATNLAGDYVNTDIYVRYTDANGCTATAKVTLDATGTCCVQPDAGTDGSISVCNADPSEFSFNLFNSLTDTPDNTGSWTETTMAPNSTSGVLIGTGHQGAVNFSNVTSGVYVFTYSIAGTMPCTDDTAIVTVTVTDCFDIALTKVLVNPATVYSPGDLLTFTVQVCNQGDVTAYDIEVTDYVPVSDLIFDPNKNMPSSGANGVTWSGVLNDEFPTHVIDEIASKTCVNIDIDLNINPSFAGTQIINDAEITFATNIDGSMDEPIDEDSTTDDNRDDPSEESSDNEIDDESNGSMDDSDDEDDFDWALVMVCPANCGGAIFAWSGDQVMNVGDRDNNPGSSSEMGVGSSDVGICSILPDPDLVDGNMDESVDNCDESITICNNGSSIVDIGGWVIQDAASGGATRHIFPSGTMIASGVCLTLYNSDLSTAPSCGSGIWNNGSETAYLYDGDPASGGMLIDEQSYTTSVDDVAIEFCSTPLQSPDSHTEEDK